MMTLNAPGGELDTALVVVDGPESVRQRVAQRVRHYLGEWFLDTASGVPYYREVLTRPTSVGAAVAALTAAVRSVDGVEEVIGAEGAIDNVTRRFRYTADVQVADGTTFAVVAGEE